MNGIGRIRVAGHSMEPSLHHGDELLYLALPPRAGKVVVARDPRDRSGVEGGPGCGAEEAPRRKAPCEEQARWLVKRVAAVDGDDVILASDRPGHEGLLVERSQILGRVVLRYR